MQAPKCSKFHKPFRSQTIECRLLYKTLAFRLSSAICFIDCQHGNCKMPCVMNDILFSTCVWSDCQHGNCKMPCVVNDILFSTCVWSAGPPVVPVATAASAAATAAAATAMQQCNLPWSTPRWFSVGAKLVLSPHTYGQEHLKALAPHLPMLLWFLFKMTLEQHFGDSLTAAT